MTPHQIDLLTAARHLLKIHDVSNATGFARGRKSQAVANVLQLIDLALALNEPGARLSTD